MFLFFITERVKINFKPFLKKKKIDIFLETSDKKLTLKSSNFPMQGLLEDLSKCILEKWMKRVLKSIYAS